MFFDPNVSQSGADLIFSQLVVSGLAAKAIEVLKHSKQIPWINNTTKIANRVVSALVAGAAAVGIHFTFDHSGGTLVITGLTMAGMFHFAWEFVRSYAVQEYLRGSIANGKTPDAPPPAQ